jgi:ABC-type oligopeptide transport system ATPase subunit
MFKGGNQIMKKPILQVRNLAVSFKKNAKYTKALKEVSFDLYENEILGIIGESGSGKTTIAKAVMRLLSSKGQIVFENKQINKDNVNFLKDIKKAISEEESAKFALIRLTKYLIKETDTKINEEKLERYINDIALFLYSCHTTLKVLSSNIDYFKINIDVSSFQNLILDSLSELSKIIPLYKNVETFKKTNPLLLQIISNISSSLISFSSIKLLLKQKDNFKKPTFEKNKKHHLLKKDLQIIMQDPSTSLNERMKVNDIIAEGLINFKKQILPKNKNNKDTKKLIHNYVKNTLSFVGLSENVLNKYPFELSGGQKQRVSIARGVIIQPKLLVADEPISSLDVTIRAQILNILKQIKEKSKLSILFISHDLSTIRYFCDRVIVVYKGNIVEIASSDELYKNPIHPYTKKLLSSTCIKDKDCKIFNEKETKYDDSAQKYIFFPRELIEFSPNHFVFCNKDEYQK